MINIQLQVEIPVRYFEQDFLDIEVSKKLAITGDKLLMRFNPVRKPDTTKLYQHRKLLSNHYMFICDGVTDDRVNFMVIRKQEISYDPE